MHANIQSPVYQAPAPSALVTVNNAIRRLSDIVSATLFFALLSLLFYSVLARSLLHLPTPWLEEIGSLLCVYFVAFSAIAAWVRKAHIAIEIVPDLFRGENRERYQLLLDVICLIFVLMALTGSLSMMSRSVSNQTTVLAISYSWYYLGVAIAFGGIFITTFVRLIDTVVGTIRN
ncbi:MAG: TRAP transporter small permease subunit [Oceanospirillaceae bacterium]|nr:TRAP transporter small permease subunit [Oceanospirillaceae bacterium]